MTRMNLAIAWCCWLVVGFLIFFDWFPDWLIFIAYVFGMALGIATGIVITRWSTSRDKTHE